MLDDLAGDLGTLQEGHASADVVAVGAKENFLEYDVAARIADERRNAICLARLDTKLLAAGFDDGVRHGSAK